MRQSESCSHWPNTENQNVQCHVSWPSLQLRCISSHIVGHNLVLRSNWVEEQITVCAHSWAHEKKNCLTSWKWVLTSQSWQRIQAENFKAQHRPCWGHICESRTPHSSFWFLQHTAGFVSKRGMLPKIHFGLDISEKKAQSDGCKAEWENILITL